MQSKFLSEVLFSRIWWKVAKINQLKLHSVTPPTCQEPHLIILMSVVRVQSQIRYKSSVTVEALSVTLIYENSRRVA